MSSALCLYLDVMTRFRYRHLAVLFEVLCVPDVQFSKMGPNRLLLQATRQSNWCTTAVQLLLSILSTLIVYGWQVRRKHRVRFLGHDIAPVVEYVHLGYSKYFFFFRYIFRTEYLVGNHRLEIINWQATIDRQQFKVRIYVGVQKQL